MGGHLATADSNGELGFLRQLKGARTVVWIGGHPGQCIAYSGKLGTRVDSGFKKSALIVKNISNYICEWDY